MANIFFHPEADEEYDEAFAWYQARSSGTATRFETEIDRLLGLIANNPEMFARCDDKHRFAILRKFPYSIVYQIQPDQILVVAVAHSSRTTDYWQHRT